LGERWEYPLCYQQAKGKGGGFLKGRVVRNRGGRQGSRAEETPDGWQGREIKLTIKGDKPGRKNVGGGEKVSL